MTPGLPAGYLRVTAGRCSVVASAAHEDDARALLAEGTLYEAAARDLGARSMEGRGVAYAIALPVSGLRVVVRHNRHGGLLARVTRDLFLPPTRAPYELSMALRLAERGIRTPEVVMYGVERRAGALRRADVMTREILDGRDLASYMMPGEDAGARAEAWRATRELLRALAAAGARHHDLNVKNVLLTQGTSRLEAWVLDVDRVRFGEPASRVESGNAARLLRSALKWRELRGAEFAGTEIEQL
jgi:3-deoxy-D-manno-octulosonic acid kinase